MSETNGKIGKRIFGVIVTVALAVLAVRIVSFLIVLFEPAYPPYEPELSTDISEYMMVNTYVEELLQTQYTDFFPSRVQPSSDANYYYSYCYDDRELHLTLYLRRRPGSQAEYKAEVYRVKGFPHRGEKSCGNVTYIIFEMPPEEKIERYLKPYTRGQSMVWGSTFSVVRTDESKNERVYLLAYEYDHTMKQQVTVDFLKIRDRAVSTQRVLIQPCFRL